MRYITTVFLVVSCAATGIHCMDSEQKALILKEQFAKISWFQNANPKEIKVIGLPEESQSEKDTAQLQQAFLGALQAVSFEFADKESTTPTICVNPEMLVPLVKALEQLKRTKEQKEKDILIVQLIQKHKEANEAYRSLEHAMTFFTGDNEYWNSDLPRQNELRLERLKQDTERARAELERSDPTCKRYDQHFLKAWQLDA